MPKWVKYLPVIPIVMILLCILAVVLISEGNNYFKRGIDYWMSLIENDSNEYDEPVA